jgi:hypothetical protein
MMESFSSLDWQRLAIRLTMRISGGIKKMENFEGE